MSVTLADGTLRLGGAPLVAISDTQFLWGSNQLEFVTDQRGRVTHFVTIFVEGDLVARKLPDGKKGSPGNSFEPPGARCEGRGAALAGLLE